MLPKPKSHAFTRNSPRRHEGVWTAPALRELEAIGDYIARDNSRASARIVTRIFDRVDMLADHPETGRLDRIAGTRELVVTDTPFIVPYRIRGDQVEILSVFHGARRWPDSFG